MSIKRDIVIIGASSFIGRHLVRELSKDNNINLRLFLHTNTTTGIETTNNIQCIKGDLFDSGSLIKLITPGCTLINLAFLRDASGKDNLTVIKNIIDTCRQVGVKRLVHCSTAVVVGKTKERVISESISCIPNPGYEKVKWDIENALIDGSANSFELAILRPTAVLGSGGKNLVKLANAISYGNRYLNYVKSCFHNHRKMNLVCIDNVVAALKLLAYIEKPLDHDIFIISDDDSQINNYRDIEVILMNRFGYTDYLIPRLIMPRLILSTLLKLARKPNTDPGRIFSSNKLFSLGFKKSVSFETGLDMFIQWYLQSVGNSNYSK